MSGATSAARSRACWECSTSRTTTASRQEPFTVIGADVAPWAFAGTGLRNGSAFGRYGIEIDGRDLELTAGVQVLATIPDLLGPRRSAEMTYYETEQGARVFAAGVLNFGGTIMLWPERAACSTTCGRACRPISAPDPARLRAAPGSRGCG